MLQIRLSFALSYYRLPPSLQALQATPGVVTTSPFGSGTDFGLALSSRISVAAAAVFTTHEGPNGGRRPLMASHGLTRGQPVNEQAASMWRAHALSHRRAQTSASHSYLNPSVCMCENASSKRSRSTSTVVWLSGTYSRRKHVEAVGVFIKPPPGSRAGTDSTLMGSWRRDLGWSANGRTVEAVQNCRKSRACSQLGSFRREMSRARVCGAHPSAKCTWSPPA